jgi:poly-gamma-glutamate synthesis protein (capsule biosynthesis protein)
MLNFKNSLLILSYIIIFIVTAVATYFVCSKVYGVSSAETSSSENTNTSEVVINDAATINAEPVKVVQSISITIAGDTMFDRAVDYHYRGTKIFEVISNIKETFGKTDISFLNLEGPISDEEIPADGTRDSLIFNMPPLVTDVLVDLGIDGVSLANNHTNNHGKAGVANTKRVLLAKNIQVVGEEATFGDYSVGRFVNGEAKLSVVTINCLEVKQDLSTIIAQEKASGAKVIVFPHWGEEYNPIHNTAQEKLAHAWVDAGADLIVGSHPHVVQDAEEYKGKPIFYSIGNFIFDQTWSVPTQQGLILKAFFVDNDLEIEMLPIVSRSYKPELKTGEAKDNVMNSFFGDFGQDGAAGNLKFKI